MQEQEEEYIHLLKYAYALYALEYKIGNLVEAQKIIKFYEEKKNKRNLTEPEKKDNQSNLTVEEKIDRYIQNDYNPKTQDKNKDNLTQAQRDLDNELLEVIEHGTIEEVKNTVFKGANIHAKNDKALSLAWKEGRFEIFNYLLEQGAKSNNKNISFTILCLRGGSLKKIESALKKNPKLDKNKALRFSSAIGNLEAVKNLINNGADDINTALEEAYLNFKFETMKYLVKQGADIDTILLHACFDGNLRAVETLLESGGISGDIDLVLEQARKHNKTEIVNYLKKYKKSQEKVLDEDELSSSDEDQTPIKNINNYLISNCMDGDLKKVKKALNKGADLYARDDMALTIAVQHDRVEVFNYLLERWKKPLRSDISRLVRLIKGDLKSAKKFRAQYPDIDPNKGLIFAAGNGQLNIVKFLVENEDNLNLDDALQVASSQGKLNVIDYLIEQKVDSQQVLNEVCYGGHLEVAKKLLEKGFKGKPLDHASSGGNLELVKYLVDQNKYDINSALVEACAHGRLKIVKYLVSKGADVNFNNYEPIKNASKYHYFPIVQYLVENGAEIPGRALDDDDDDDAQLSEKHRELLKKLKLTKGRTRT